MSNFNLTLNLQMDYKESKSKEEAIMDLVLIELVLWAGLLFFFWALKEGLSHVESDIDSLGLMSNARQIASAAERLSFYRPDHVEEPIGSYRDAQIYRYAVIQGRVYQFDRILLPESAMTVDAEERCVAPGLVYQECSKKLSDSRT
jgi:hypothetical protein